MKPLVSNVSTIWCTDGGVTTVGIFVTAAQLYTSAVP